MICTLGPKCWSEDIIGQLRDAGLYLARFNFSHGDHAGHAEVLAYLEQFAAVHDLAPLIRFGHRVERAAPLPGGDTWGRPSKNGTWYDERTWLRLAAAAATRSTWRIRG